jgi:hypothetical protein
MIRRRSIWDFGGWSLRLAVIAIVCLTSSTALAGADPLHDLLELTSQRVSALVEQFSEVKCTEQVTQEKIKDNGKVEIKQDSTYDYLVILTNAGGELSLDESRLPVHQSKLENNKNLPLLVSNGFATLFLVFHPYYADGFKFITAGNEVISGQSLAKVNFQHIRGMRSPAALALRGREFPMELSGTAWIDPATGNIAKISANVEDTLQDVGIRALRSEVIFAAVPFRDMKEIYWFPTNAAVEVETPRQHWRNTHRFTDYKRFSVSTEEKVAEK